MKAGAGLGIERAIPGAAPSCDGEMPEPYMRWLAFLFARPDSDEAWYFEMDADSFEAEGQADLMAALVMQTFLRSGQDLNIYSDQQIATGLNYIFNNSCSDVVYDLKSSKLSLAQRIACIQSIATLYQDCFRPRCHEALSHRNQGMGNPLNGVCYMLWDFTPLAYWEEDPDKARMYSAIVELLAHCLEIPHLACIESALHGLGHLHLRAATEVEAVIDAWLARTKTDNAELLQYAQAARIGHVL